MSLSLHQWGEIWHSLFKISPIGEACCPVGQKPQNRPLSNLNTDNFAGRNDAGNKGCI